MLKGDAEGGYHGCFAEPPDWGTSYWFWLLFSPRARQLAFDAVSSHTGGRGDVGTEAVHIMYNRSRVDDKLSSSPT